MSLKTLRSVFSDTIPVMAGYLVLGIGFGMIMNSDGFPLWAALAMSIFIYAGSMQFASVNLIMGGASLITIALTTLAVNARHFFYGISMIDKYKGMKAAKPYLIFSLTDETYSLVCSSDRGKDYYLAVSVIDHIYWIAGTFIGFFVGEKISFNTKGVDFALTALFVTVFVDQWMNTKEHFSAIAGVSASILCLLIFGRDGFLIPAMAVIAVSLIINMKRGKSNE